MSSGPTLIDASSPADQKHKNSGAISSLKNDISFIISQSMLSRFKPSFKRTMASQKLPSISQTFVYPAYHQSHLRQSILEYIEDINTTGGGGRECRENDKENIPQLVC